MVEFKSEKISDTVTRIHGIAGELMYLIEGKDSAALIDTGSGVGSLKTYVEFLTNKPYIILLTHGHVDHAMGAPEFDTKIYMNPADQVVCHEHSDLDLRKGFLSMTESFKFVTDDDYIPCQQFENLSLLNGDVFDLGGVTLEVYECLGHTPGSMVILLKEERTLILGDACNFFTFVFDEHSVGVTTFIKKLKRLKELTDGKFDRVYLSHQEGDAPKQILGGVLQVCEDVLAGKADDIPFEFMGHKAFIAKAVDPLTMQRTDGGIGNIVYDKGKILQ